MAFIIAGAPRYIMTPMTAMTAMPMMTDMLANLQVRSFLLAPMLCPTRVVAALEIPYPGI